MVNSNKTVIYETGLFHSKKLENKILHYTKVLFYDSLNSLKWLIPKIKVFDLINETFHCTCALHDAIDTTISH